MDFEASVFQPAGQDPLMRNEILSVSDNEYF